MAPESGDGEVSMNAEDDPIMAEAEFDEIARAERAYFDGWRPRYQPPAAPPPPTHPDHAWVYEGGAGDGFEDYVAEWRRGILGRTLDVEKRERELACRNHINAKRKQGRRALTTRQITIWLEEARRELREAQAPPYRGVAELIKEHAVKGVEDDQFRIRNVITGGIIGPKDLIPFAEGFVGHDPEVVKEYVTQVLQDGHEPLIG